MTDQQAVDWFELNDKQWIGICSEQLMLTKTGLTKEQLSDSGNILERTIVFVEQDGNYELHIAINEKKGSVEILKKCYGFRHNVDAMIFRNRLLQCFPVTFRLKRTKNWLLFSGRMLVGLLFWVVVFGYFVFFNAESVAFGRYKVLIIPLALLVFGIAIFRMQKEWKRYRTNDFYCCRKETPVNLRLKDDELLDS